MKVNILGISVDNVSFEEATSKVRDLLLAGNKDYIVTPNPEFIVYAQNDIQFRDTLNKATLAVPDGIGLIWASKILGNPLKERVAGVDLAEKALSLAAELGKTVFFLGGNGNTSQRAVEVMRVKYPGLRVISCWPGDASSQGDQETLEKIGTEKIGLLLVAYGHPKQEFWINRNLPKLEVGLAMGVGGAFDFWSGDISRASKWVRNLGLEWLYRLLRQPWRIKRQLALIKFGWLVLRSKF